MRADAAGAFEHFWTRLVPPDTASAFGRGWCLRTLLDTIGAFGHCCCPRTWLVFGFESRDVVITQCRGSFCVAMISGATRVPSL